MHRTPRVDPADKRAELIRTYDAVREVYYHVVRRLRIEGYLPLADALDFATKGQRFDHQAAAIALIKMDTSSLHTANLVGMRFIGFTEYGALLRSFEEAKANATGEKPPYPEFHPKFPNT